MNVYLVTSRADPVASLREVTVVAGDGRVMCERCGVAETPAARMRGLLRRRELLPGEGLLLRPAPSIHTFFMRFPIDVVFLDWDLRVVRVDANVKPWRVRGCHGARAVIELRAGEAVRRGFAQGQRLRLGDGTRMSEPVASGPRAHVLLAGGDRRFVSVTSFLLSRAGFTVRTTRKAEDVLASLGQEPADVVVVDASAQVTAAARTVASVRAMHPGIGVVVVADGDAVSDLSALSALPKWSPFERLEEAVNRALLRARTEAIGDDRR